MSRDMIALYRPRCGSDGADFMAIWCNRCERDRAFDDGNGDSCEIVATTMAVDVDHPDYPKEWRRDGPEGPRCTAFEPRAAKEPT